MNFRYTTYIRLLTFTPPHHSKRPGHEPGYIRNTCEKRALELLKCTLSYDNSSFREVLVIIIIQMIHAVVILVELDLSGQSFQAFEITSNLYRKLEAVAQIGKFLLPQMFCSVLRRLFDWHRSA